MLEEEDGGILGEDMKKIMCVAYDHHQGYEVYGYVELYQLSIYPGVG